jgi:DNA-directed RNA polymerase specialized sigma24 family protein
MNRAPRTTCARRAASELERREDLSRIARALERLDPDKRAMIMLRVNEGLSYEAIAAHLGVPIGTVMSRLNRARLADFSTSSESPARRSGRATSTSTPSAEGPRSAGRR